MCISTPLGPAYLYTAPPYVWGESFESETIPTHRTLIRSTFKALFSLFCPLVIFFFSLSRGGQTKYDRLLRCAVIDARSLYRPVNTGQGQPTNHQPRLLQVG